MKQQTTVKYLFGTVSHATMRSEDLIPRFIEALEHFDAEKAKEYQTRWDDTCEMANEDERLEESDYLVESLFDALDSHAAPYFYFGAHAGDRSDYGFWLSEGAFEDFDGLKVSDLSEVPKDYRGEVLHVNDHGNTSLYSANAGELTEVWAIA